MGFVKPLEYVNKGKLYTMLMDGRETGKTTGAIKGCIEEFFNRDGEYSVGWLRRWKTDTQDAKQGFFSKIIENEWFPGHKFSVQGNKGFVDDKPVFHFLTLSVSSRTRGSSIPNLRLIVFDEFLINTQVDHYLGKKEPFAFDTLFDTYARPRTTPKEKRVQALFMANTFSTINPYFLYHKIKFPKGKTVFQNEFIHAEKLNSRVAKDDSEWVRFTRGKEYGDHANDAKFILDDDSFIRKLPPKTETVFNFVYGGKTWGVWKDSRNGEIFISDKHDKSFKLCFYFSKEDRTPAMLNIRAFKRSYYYALIEFCQSTGNLWFTNLEAQYTWDSIASYLNIT